MCFLYAMQFTKFSQQCFFFFFMKTNFFFFYWYFTLKTISLAPRRAYQTNKIILLYVNKWQKFTRKKLYTSNFRKIPFNADKFVLKSISNFNSIDCCFHWLDHSMYDVINYSLCIYFKKNYYNLLITKDLALRVWRNNGSAIRLVMYICQCCTFYNYFYYYQNFFFFFYAQYSRKNLSALMLSTPFLTEKSTIFYKSPRTDLLTYNASCL